MQDKQAFLLDRRTVERNIKKGLISRKDYEAHLAALKDVESNSEIIDFGPMDMSGRDDASSES
jgi:predicted RNA-binding protein associated with RNAse of E/G family